ncbi:radical SAM protein [Vibrio gigantis]|uniref:radical SAM protein n=1 Tax=Vibrio gigantis TaxID=296199 RepID=UPI002FC85306
MELESRILNSVDSRNLHLMIFSTEKCNFRCTYCYEDFEKGKLTGDVVSGIKNLIKARAHDLNNLQISWFGGEPLLNYKGVVSISEYIKDIQKSHPDLSYQSDMTTNGYLLTNDKYETLSNLGVTKFQISLDGDQYVHDKTRILVNGQGTFNTIWDNLKKIKLSSLSANILLRIHYDSHNWSKISEFSKKIGSTFGDDRRFSVFFKDIVRLGGTNDHNIKITNKTDKEKIERELYRNATMQTKTSPNLIGKEQYICYASQANSFVIRSDGYVNKCTVALSDPNNFIGKLHPNGKLEINNNKLKPWLQGLSSLNPKDLACPYGSLAGKSE